MYKYVKITIYIHKYLYIQIYTHIYTRIYRPRSALFNSTSLCIWVGGNGKNRLLLTNNKDVNFCVAPDKKPCQMRRETLSKKPKIILASKDFDKDVYPKKSMGSIYEGKRVLCSVIITGPETARLDWCHPK